MDKNKRLCCGLYRFGLLVFGVYLTARQDDDSQPKTSNSMLDFNKGIRALIFSTVGYGVYTIIINATGFRSVGNYFATKYWYVSGGWFLCLQKVKVDRFVWMNMTTGLLWGLGNICMLLMRGGLAYWLLFITNGIIISTLGGIFLLGERKSKRNVLCYFWLHFCYSRWYSFRVYESVNGLFTLILQG